MRAPFLSLEELNTSSAEELATTIASANDEHQRLETEDKIESQELAQLEEHIDNAQVAAGAIDETAERLEATYPEGVPDEVVQTLEPVLEALKNVVGFKPGSMKVAIEGLSGKERTRVAVEGLTETAKKIWEAIKAAFKRLVDFVKGLFSRQGKKQEVLEKKIEAALDSWEKAMDADGVKSGGSAPETIMYPNTIIKRDGSAPSYQEMSEWLKKDAPMFMDMFALVGKDLRSFHEYCQDVLEKAKTADELEQQLLEWSKKANTDLFGGLSKRLSEEKGFAVALSTLGGARGEISILDVERPGQPGVKHACAALGFETSDVTDPSKANSSPYGPVLTKEQATQLLKDMEAELKLWPDSHKYETNSRVVTEFGEIFTRSVNSTKLPDADKQKMLHLLGDIMKRLRSNLSMMRWSHNVAMNVMMGISSVCASSNFNHAMNDTFGK